MMRSLVAALVLLPAVANATVYKCTVNGVLTFTDQTCSHDSELLIIQSAPPINSGSQPSGANSTAEWLQQAEKDGKQRQIETLERQNRQLKADMNREVETVQKEAAAPGYYGEDPGARSAAVKKDFGTKIQANQAKIEALRKELQ